MTCNETITWIDAFLDNELELSRQLDVEQHLKGCATCARQMQERRSLQAALHDPALRFDLPSGLERELRDSVRRVGIEKSPERVRWSWTGWWGGFASAAALTSALFLAAPYLTLPYRENRIAQDVTHS